MYTHQVPRVDHWPRTLQSAAVLFGTLAHCGPGYRPVGWPETPSVRCAALSAFLSPRLVAIEETAAWVWGALRVPARPLALSTRSGRIPLVSGDPEVKYHEFRFDPGEFTYFGDLAVTTRIRTAYDLLRSPRPFTASRHVACRLLLAGEPAGPAVVADRATRSNKAEQARVTARLCTCYAD